MHSCAFILYRFDKTLRCNLLPNSAVLNSPMLEANNLFNINMTSKIIILQISDSVIYYYLSYPVGLMNHDTLNQAVYISPRYLL